MEELRELDEVERVAYAGSARRGKETVGDLDLLVASGEPEPTMEWFRSMPEVQEVVASGPTKTSVIWRDGIQVDLRVVPLESFGAAMQYFTGSKEHNVRLREMASAQGRKINEYGIFEVDSDKRLGGENEDDIYSVLGMDMPPPELREGAEEIRAAKERALPTLINERDIRGDLHAHTTWSDGKHSIEEMVEGAEARGYSYLAITDHSKSLQIARGLSIDELSKQIEAIREINKGNGEFRILCGSEVDITASGELDYPDEILAELDVVIASIHVGLGGDSAKQTRRTLAACENPYVNIIGHMTGRLIGRREPFPLDVSEVLRVASETGTAVEINANPYRLDVCDRHAREARAQGVTIVINTDAHSVRQLEFMEYGILTARRGWLGPEAVLNARPLADVLSFLQEKR